MTKPTSDRYLVIGDTHLPAEHPDYLDFCTAVRAKYRCGVALHVGDFVDWHAVSFHETDPDLPSAGDELSLVRHRIGLWGKAFPRMQICMGNHDKLSERRMRAHGMPKAFLKQYNDIIGAPRGWVWHPSYYEFKLGCGMPVVMQHGISSSLEAGKLKLRTASLVSGHHHSTAGVAWNTAPDWRLFYLAVGCGVDMMHPAMAYADQGVLKMPTLGCGVILEGYAAHLPMWLDKSGRWNGVVP